MASGVYNSAKTEPLKKNPDFVNDTIKYMLLNNSHSFNADHDEKADIVANEISGTGYTAGGVTLGSKTVTQDNTDDEGVWDAADAAWTTASFTAYHGVPFDDTTTSPADMTILSHDYGGAQTVTAGTFTVQFAAEGLLNIN